MEKFINLSRELLSFIEKSTDSFHAVKTVSDMLLEKGYRYLPETEEWSISTGKYFTKRNNSSLIAFEIPENDFDSFGIIAAHCDSPCFKVKELHSLKVEGNYTKLNTEPYGGMIMSSWMDRPLGVSGRLLVKTNSGVKTILCDTENYYLIIPNMESLINQYIGKKVHTNLLPQGNTSRHVLPARQGQKCCHPDNNAGSCSFHKAADSAEKR